MKYSILFFSCLLISQTQAFSQSGFVISPEFFDDSYTEELNNTTYLRSEALMENTSGNLLIINWEIINIDMPPEWGLSTSDKDMSYPPGPPFATKNGNPITLEAGEMNIPFNIDIYPKETSGCGSFDVLISLDSDGSVLDTIEYQVSVNDDNCFISSIDDPLFDLEIELFPNPFVNHFLIRTESLIQSITLYDLQGNALLYQDNCPLNSHYIDVSSLARGIYFLELISTSNKRILKKVVKR